MAILDLKRDDWLDAMSISDSEIPRVLILEGTWWRAQAEETRLARLEDVRESAFPEIYLGRTGDVQVAYCCAYGAARAVEPAHVFAQLGTPLLIQLGTCGSLNPQLEPGMVAVPDFAAARDGLSPLYGGGDTIALDSALSGLARKMLGQRSVDAANTRPSHLAKPVCTVGQDVRRMERGRAGNHRYGTGGGWRGRRQVRGPAIGLLSVWDGLSRGRTFLDSLEKDAQAALEHTNRLVFEIALDLARAMPASGEAP